MLTHPFHILKYLLEFILVMVLIEVFCLQVTLSQPSKVRAQNIPNLIESLVKMDLKAVKAIGHGWAKWKSHSDDWDEIVAVSNDSLSGTADLITSIQQSKSTFILSADSIHRRYRYFQGTISKNPFWKMAAWTTLRNGVINNIMMVSSDGKKIIIGDNNSDGKLDYIATPIDQHRWVVLPFDNIDFNFKATIIFDPSRSKYVAVANYALKSSDIRDIFILSNEGKWIEYAYQGNGKKISAVAIHDTIPGKLLIGLFDLDGKGIANAILDKNKITGKNEVSRLSKDIKLNSLASPEISSMIVIASRTATDLWKNVKPILLASKAIGYRFPVVKRLPIQNKN